jgi:protein-tyrosine phosphatase
MEENHEIMKYLYFGNVKPTYELFHLIVNCTHDIPFSYFCNERVRIPIEDDTQDDIKIIQMLIKTNVLEKIHNCISNKQNVLVHCIGTQKQRSFVIIICYLLQYHRFTPRRAVEYVYIKIKKENDLNNIRFSSSIRLFYEILQK